MITGYKQLTGRYLKSNKKRTILTIIGIVLSVALISTIGLFFKSIQASEIEDVKGKYGSYHIAFRDINDSTISKIINNPKISRYGFIIQDKDINVDNKVKVSLNTSTDKGLELLPYRIKKGRIPNNKKEIAIEQWVVEKINTNVKLGSKININNKEYTLTGILENSEDSQSADSGIALTKDNNLSKNKAVLLAEISSKANLSKAIKELESLTTKKNVTTNFALVSLLGGSTGDSGMRSFYITIGIIIGIVVIATIAVIYNSFQISVVERIKQYGLLRAVGTTPKQIRKIVLREATILGSIGVPIGLLLSVIVLNILGFVFKIIGADTVLPMKPTISPMVLVISAIIGMVSIYLSALLPAVFASRTSPLVAISSRAFLSKDKIKKRNNKLVGKIFGFEGTLAGKNIKRSKKRYRITVFSIVISIVLFVMFKSFMDMSLNISGNVTESNNLNFSVESDGHNGRNAVIDENTIEKIKSINAIDKVYKMYNADSFDMAFDKSREVKEVKSIKGIYSKVTFNGEEKAFMPDSSIEPYDKESLEACKKYLKSGSIDEDVMNKENGVIVIGRSVIYNQKTRKTYLGPVSNIKVGDEIDVQYVDFKQDTQDSDGKFIKKDFGKGTVKKIKVVAVLNDEALSYNGNSSALKVITTPEVLKSLTGKSDISPNMLKIKLKNANDEETAKNSISSAIKSNSSSLKLINLMDENRRQKSTILMVEILIYGFVIVISLIGSVNIINTLTTNIIIRKKEFAALKCIGLTQKGLKKMIVLEGIFYGIIGSIYGSIIGCGLSYLIYKGLNNVREIPWNMPWAAMGIASLAAIIIGYISVLSPLSKIKKENLIETVREDY